MSWYIEASGTQAATVTTEHTLATVTKPGRYRLWVDFVNVAAGTTPDIVEIRHKTKLLSGDTSQLALPIYSVVGGQVLNLNVEFPELVIVNELVVTLKQTQGTGRNYKWALLREFSSQTAAVVSDAGNTSSTFKTDLTESTTGYWKDCLLLFVSGSLAGQVKKVSGYDGTTKFVTLSSAFTAAPSATDKFVLVNV